MPTGRVYVGNLKEWFKVGAVAVRAGSELCFKELAEAGRFDEIAARAHDFAEAVRLARVEGDNKRDAHITSLFLLNIFIVLQPESEISGCGQRLNHHWA